MACLRYTFMLLAAVCSGLAGCTTQPRADATLSIAAAAGAATSYVTVNGFELLVVRGPAEGSLLEAESLHVYIAGDGTPWRGNQVARNPGPFKPLAIELMLRDPAPSVFLGRPCYHLQSAFAASNCRPSLWSFERFSPRVVAAMAVGLRQLSRAADDAPLTLIGYSGGGVLAVLLAHEVAAVDTVVTLAAPLDVSAWSAHHNYTPLVGSLDPAQLPVLRRKLVELHFQGRNDQEVPPAITEGYFEAQETAGRNVGRQLEAHQHRCCWVKHWPEMLPLEHSNSEH